MKQSQSLLLSSLVVFSLALVIDRASAWTLPHSSTATVVIGGEHNRRLFLLRRSTFPLQATGPIDGNNNIDDENDNSSSRNRRNFFRSAATMAATTAASISLLVASSSSSSSSFGDVRAANAAESTAIANSSYSKVYKPGPHSMDGKVVLITGGNAGLGLESTKRLVEAGATVIFTSRDAIRGNRAVEDVHSYLEEGRLKTHEYDGDASTTTTPFMGKVHVANLDLCDIENIKSFDDRLSSIIGKGTKIDVLVNNAGVMAIPTKQLTKDGYERTFQTNHLGHFVLTSLLLTRLQFNARVINVSSMAYQFAGAKDGLELDNLNGERNYGPWSSYGQSKLANILFTNEMQDRALKSKEWSNLRVVALHPGAVQTDLARYVIGEEKFNTMKAGNGGTTYTSWTDKLLMEGLSKFVKTVQEGASTQIYLSSINDEALRPGEYYSDGKVTQVLPFARDGNKAKELWTISEKLSGVKFNL